jgi:ABC-type amino acid transport system permease subunit
MAASVVSPVYIWKGRKIMSEWLDSFKADLILNFVEKNRWKYYTDGLVVTLKLTFFSLIIGVLIGTVIAIIRSTYDKNMDGRKKTPGTMMLRLLNAICKFYLTVIRGTPVVVQIMIMFYVIMASSNNKLLAGCLAFGINSGAYVAEIIRSGIESIDNGQFEAGRSLGFNYVQTMRHIILPQAVKNVLPALANEFITLLKETSVVGYIAMQDITKAASIVGGVTYNYMLPLFATALIYLVLVLFFTRLVAILERRLKRDER